MPFEASEEQHAPCRSVRELGRSRDGGATTLVECLEAGEARADPSKVAVAGAGGALTYGALFRGARGLAGRLAAAGVGPGSRVGVWMDKTPEAVQAIAGVLLAGAAYVPLDPRSPAPRCRAIAADCRLDALVADAPRLDALAVVLAGHAPRLLVLHGIPRERFGVAPGRVVERFEDACAAPAAGAARPPPDALAYVLYPPGSTGDPKRVAHPHASGAAFVRWVQERFGIVADDVFSSHASLHLDLSISDLFASLGSGASVRLVSPVEGMIAPWLVRNLDAWGISVWYSAPSVLVSMLESGLEATPPARLRLVLFAGEVFPLPQLRRLRRALPRVRLVKLSGPTETNVGTSYEVPAELPDDRR